MVIFLGTEKLEEITGKLACPPDTPAAVVYHASWPDQKIVRGTVADIAAKAREAGIEHTALLLVGGVVGDVKRGARQIVPLFMTRTVVVAPAPLPAGCPADRGIS